MANYFLANVTHGYGDLLSNLTIMSGSGASMTCNVTHNALFELFKTKAILAFADDASIGDVYLHHSNFDETARYKNLEVGSIDEPEFIEQDLVHGLMRYCNSAKDEVIEMERDSLELDNIHVTIVTRKIHNTDYSTIFAVDNIGRTLSCSMVYAPLYERIMSKDIMNLIFGENARYTYTTI